MDPRSEVFLLLIHPDLAAVMRRAEQHPQPFRVVYGVRTEEAERSAVATGHSTTLHSRHLPQSHENMLACAVDVGALDARGEITWAKGHEAEVYGAIAKQIKAAAAELDIPLQWGGDPIGAWVPGKPSHFRDWGHFQLPWEQYP